MLAAIADISQWSFTHKLKLNPDKSEVIWLGSRQQLAKLSEEDKSLQLPDGLVRSSTTVKNLGVVIDERLSFDDQANTTTTTATTTATNIGRGNFAVSGPDIWSSLPADLHLSSLSTASFARHLNAHLFPSTE